MVERAGGAGDPAGQVEVEEEILPEASARRDAVPGDDLAQRRQAVGSAGVGLSAAPPPRRHLGRSRSAAIRLSGRADAAAGDVEGGAVVGRGADERQAERDVDAAVEIDAS